MKKYEEAIEEFKKAIEIDANFQKPYYNMANTLRKMGKIP